MILHTERTDFAPAYHTGAGLGDAVFSTNASVAPEAYYDHFQPDLRHGQQFFMIGDRELGPWRMVVSSVAYQCKYRHHVLGLVDRVAAYQAVTISSASDPDTAGYYFDADGLHWNSSSFAGWLACDWWHSSPQLFAELKRDRCDNPKTCSKVKLIPIAF